MPETYDRALGNRLTWQSSILCPIPATSNLEQIIRALRYSTGTTLFIAIGFLVGEDGGLAKQYDIEVRGQEYHS